MKELLTTVKKFMIKLLAGIATVLLSYLSIGCMDSKRMCGGA